MNRAAGRLAGPFAGLRPAPGRAAAVAAPPYDVLDAAEARALADGNPLSFLKVSRADAFRPEGEDPFADEVYAAAARGLRGLEASGALLRDSGPAYYVYRMTTGDRAQTGVAMSVSADAYADGRVRRHELTRPEKEDDRARQIDAVDAITGPVQLVHKADPELAVLLARATEEAPVAAARVAGTRHELWKISGPASMAAVSARIDAMEALYIGDGHHRSAAGARVIEARRAEGRGSGADGFLGVGFPDDEVVVLAYNRVVRDLNGLAPDELLSALARAFELGPSDGPVRPPRPGTFGMYLAGRWRLLSPKVPETAGDPVERLDVSILARRVLAPHLGVGDPRTDPRIDFAGGARGAEEVAARVDSGAAAVGFTLHPVGLGELMAASDAGLIMPPKSTWFEPKLADGLISLPLS